MTTQSKSTHRGAGEGTIYKDTVRNRWVAQVTVGYDGRTGRLIRRSKSARTRKEAQAALAALKEKYASQTAILASRMTVGLWLDLEALCSFDLQNVINKRLYNHYREALIEAPSIYYCWCQMMLVEFMTGLRRGELLALHWEDLNLEEGWLKVRHALVNGRKKAGMDAYPVFLSEPKTEKSRRQRLASKRHG